MKILASDLDGTLRVTESIGEDDLKAIKEFRKQGNKFIISTGRTISGIKKVFEEADLEFDYLVLCNGGIILDSEWNIIENNIIDFEIGREIIEEFFEEEEMGLYCDDGENTLVVHNPNQNYSRLVFLADLLEQRIEKEEVLNQKKNFQMISIFSLDECYDRAEKARIKLDEKYGQRLDIYRNQYFIDLVPKGCSKGDGVLKVLEMVGGDVKNLYTVGDSFNDISMFKVTENSYTFNRAEDGVKLEAKNHIDYVHEIINGIL